MFIRLKCTVVNIIAGILLISGAAKNAGAEGKQAIPSMPMPVDYEETADYRWLGKPVYESRLLDDMEATDTWSHGGQGEMMLTREHSVDGTGAIRLRFPTSQFENPRRGGGAGVTRVFPGEDWSDYNRLSFYVYPDFPDYYTISIVVTLHNEGTVRVPDKYGREGKSFLHLKANEWNHIVWEIANLSRDKVTGVEFACHLHNRERGAGRIAILDFDRLELQRVDADHYEGWNVAAGQISFSHSGYQTGASKSAFGSDLEALVFSVIDSETGRTMLTKPVKTIRTHLGRYQMMDFTEVRTPGTYYLKAGNTVTRPFKIGVDVWRESIIKTINFFYCERCGFAIPGSHEACHGDLKSVHGDQSIIVNGGWHDAGDLSQGVVNTGEAVYAMFSLAERMKRSDPVLSDRLMEEAKWGLDWILKGRYGDGYRHVWAGIGFWTDGIMGTADDRTVRAWNSPWVNFIACASEALAGRVLRESAPVIASKSLAAAAEDWQFAVDSIKVIDIEITSAAVLAAIELYRATGKPEYADRAAEYARVILDCQQRAFTDWDVPMTGFFYTGPEKKQILRYDHRSSGQAPIVALAKLCTYLPNHPDWIRWYAAIVLNSEYWKKIAEYTRPYSMLPNSVYRIDEMETSPVRSVYSGEFIPEKYLRYESEEPAYREQLLNGIKVGDGYYLKMFPVFYGHRGNHGTVLSDAKALSASAHIRKDPSLADLCQRQLEWVVGRNPFCQSTMYGEGYDYATQYSETSGDIVGSLPVGIRTKRNNDLPYTGPHPTAIIIRRSTSILRPVGCG